MRGRWNGGYIGPQQTPTAGSVRGIFNAAEMQQLSGASLWPQPANDPYFQYVTALLQGNGGPPTSASSTNTINFNADASTNNFLLALNGEVRNDEFHPYQQGFYSNFFDGTSTNRLTLPSSAGNLGTAFSVEFWLYPTSATGQVIIGGAGSGAFQFGWQSSTQFGVGATGVAWRLTSTTVPTLNAWNHCMFVRSGTGAGQASLYINGTRVANGQVSDAWNTNLALYIGSAPDNSAQMYGYVSNMRFVSSATSPYNPTALTITVPTAPLTAVTNTSLLTCQSNRFIDNSTNNYSITLSGSVPVSYFQPFGQTALTAATFTNNQPSPGTNGYYGVYFDGNGDNLAIAANEATRLVTGSFTIECWFYTSNTGSQVLIAQDDGGTGSQSWQLTTSTGRQVTFTWFPTSSRGSFQFIVGGTYQTNQWNHVAAVYNASNTTLTLYLNGVSVATQSSPTFFNGNNATGIGSWNGNTSTWFTGYISNVRLVKGTAVYTSNFTPSTTPLTAIANTSLLTCQSSSIIDNSGNNLTITTAGNAAVTVAQPFTGTVAGSTVFSYGSAYFDGTGDWLTVADNVNLQLGTGDFTVEFWAMITGGATNVFRALVSKGGSSTGWGVFISNTNVWGFTDTVTNTLSSTAPVYNSWTHVVFRRAGTSAVLYINGVQVASATVSTNFNQTEQLVIGAGRALDIPFTGYISGLRIVKGTSLYNAPFIPPNMPPTAISGTQLLSLQSNGGASNSGFEDSGPFDFLITRNGNVAQGAFTPYGTNWSNYFDGSGDWISAPNINFSTNNFTIEGWFYYTGVTIGSGTNTNLWGMSNGAGANPKLMAFLTTTNIYLFDNSEIINVAHGMVPNTWYHLAFVRTGTSANQCFIYRNGVALNSTSLALGTQSSVTAVFNVGYVGESYGTPFTGYISNFRVVNGTALYTSNFTPPTAPLTAIANTSLLTCQSNRLIDTSSNNFTITRNGDVSVQRFSPFRPTVAYNSATYGGSAYFDGTGDYLNYTASLSLTGTFTLEGWFYNTSTSGQQQTICSFNSVSGNGYGSLRVDCDQGNTQFNFSVNLGTSGTAWASTISTNNAYVKNIWNHFAVCRDSGNTVRVFLNGVQIASATLSGTLYNTSTTHAIGCNNLPGAATNPFIGYISDLRLIVGTALYTSNFAPPTAPLTSTANTSLLLGMANTGQYDNAMMTYWESANNTQSTPSQYKYGTGSLYFDGTADYLTTRYTQGQWFLGNTFTIEAWVYIIARPGQESLIFSQDVAVTSSFAFQSFYATSTGVLNFSVRPTTGGAVTTVGGGTVPLATWTHCAVSVAAGQCRVFLNGTQVGSTTAVTMMAATLPQFVGVGGYGNGYNTGVANSNHLNGYIDDLRVTRGIARYTANFTPPTSQFLNT